MIETMLKTSRLISPLAMARLTLFLRQRYRGGPFRYNPIAAAREMVETVFFELDHAIQKENKVARISIETDHSRHVPTPATGGHGLVCGLIILMGAQTFTRDLSVSPTLVRLNGKPIFIDHSEGAVLLLHAIIDEVESVVGADALEAAE
jgi:hypothetical protein